MITESAAYVAAFTKSCNIGLPLKRPLSATVLTLTFFGGLGTGEFSFPIADLSISVASRFEDGGGLSSIRHE